jgi:propanediol dehydratase small subunit
VGSILANMGEHQLTIRDYLRRNNLNVTNQYLQATSRQASDSGQAGRRDSTERAAVCEQVPPDSVHSPKQMLFAGRRRSGERILFGSQSAYWNQVDPDFQKGVWGTD